MNIRNIYEEALQESTNSRGEIWRRLDLSGDRLGVRIEELLTGESSSVHHYHSLEEEHVIMLTGTATLHLGDQTQELKAGDHVCFLAGKEQAHHLINNGEDACRFLVFGERLAGDVVYYPEHSVMLVKAPGLKTYTYRPYEQREDSGG